MKQKFLIIGSTGFIGTNLVRRLAHKGEDIISFSTSFQSPLEGIEHIQGDIRNKRAVKKILKTKPDVIVCLAGLSGQSYSDKKPYQSFEINVSAYYYLLDEIKSLLPCAKVIFSSSRLEYGRPQYLPVDEVHPIVPLSYYGMHKHLVSKYCQFLYSKYSLHTTVLRTSNPYGPHPPQGDDRYNVINYFIDQALRNKPLIIYGKGLQKRDYLYIDDFIDVILLVATKQKTAGKVYNIGGGKGISLVDAAREIIAQAKKGKIAFVPWPQEEKELETGDYISNITKLYDDVGWKPQYTFKQGIKKTVAFYTL